MRAHARSNEDFQKNCRITLSNTWQACRRNLLKNVHGRLALQEWFSTKEMKRRAANGVVLSPAVRILRKGFSIPEKAWTKQGQDDIIAHVRWKLSKDDDRLYHNENKYNSGNSKQIHSTTITKTTTIKKQLTWLTLDCELKCYNYFILRSRCST